MAADSRVVYVDNDPIVLAHARDLLRGSPEGRTAYLDADFRDRERIVSAPETAGLIDFTRPVALLIVALLHFIPDDDGPGEIVERYKAAMPSGSALILSHGTDDLVDPDESRAVEGVYTGSGVDLTLRSRVRITEFFGGWDLVEPGVVAASESARTGTPRTPPWRPPRCGSSRAWRSSRSDDFRSGVLRATLCWRTRVPSPSGGWNGRRAWP